MRHVSHETRAKPYTLELNEILEGRGVLLNLENGIPKYFSVFCLAPMDYYFQNSKFQLRLLEIKCRMFGSYDVCFKHNQLCL